MRSYGRVYKRDANGKIDPDVPPYWTVVETDPSGFNDAVYITTLAQVLQLNLNESPFYADWGIPQQQTITTQVFPDLYMQITQQRFSQYFASLIITNEQLPEPTYKVNVITNRGERITAPIAV